MSLLIASKKGKWIIGGVCVFALVATASTGLASWVIGQQTSDSTNGNISVSTIEDQSCRVEITSTDDDLKVNFGPTAQGGVLIKPTTIGTKEEDLEFTIKGTLTHTSGTYSSVKIELDTTNIAGLFDTDSINGLIKLPNGFTQVGSTAIYSTTTTVTNDKFEQLYSFGWGKAFGNMNPCEYYNDSAEGRKFADVIKENGPFQKLQTLNTKTFSITVTPVLG